MTTISQNEHGAAAQESEMTRTRQRQQRPAGRGAARMVVAGQRPVASAGAARVVVAGAGFGGLAAARALARTGMQVTLIDRNLYATFQPLLYQVATAGLASSDVAYPVRAAARRYHAAFRHGDVAGIDPAARQVTLTDGTTLGYDYLILATGVAAAHHGIPGAAEHTLGLYTRTDAIILRDRLMRTLDQMSRAGGRGDVTVTIIGGGPTGVELAGTVADLRSITLPALFGDIDPARVHIRLLDRGPELLAPFHARRAQPDLRAGQLVLALPVLAARRRPDHRRGHDWARPRRAARRRGGRRGSGEQ